MNTLLHITLALPPHTFDYYITACGTLWHPLTQQNLSRPVGRYPVLSFQSPTNAKCWPGSRFASDKVFIHPVKPGVPYQVSRNWCRTLGIDLEIMIIYANRSHHFVILLVKKLKIK